MEGNNKDQNVEQTKNAVKEDAKGLFLSTKVFLKELLDFREDTDQEATISAIKNDISIQGATAWILICSIFVASVGLNANSTAVVIGAMLISPLMGPILGVGLSIAINDIDTLKKSLVNLATMIVLSLLTAFVFFYFFPLSEDTSELLGRTKPDIRDVLIAFFGGLALIIARTKKGTIASVIFGVAIATALMPPLCTVGYGLAKWAKGDVVGFSYALNAMYLFVINTIFIALATFLVLKLLGFTMIRYVNSAKRKVIARIASFLAIIVMIPAIFTFINVYKETMVDSNYQNYLKNEIQSNKNLWLQRHDIEVNKKQIKLFFNGDVNDATISDLQNELKSYEKIADYTLVVNSNKLRSVDRVMEAYDRAIKDLDNKDNIIDGLQKEIAELKLTINNYNSRLNKKDKKDVFYIDHLSVVKDAKIRFKDINEIRFEKVLSSKDFLQVDTISKVFVKWDKEIAPTNKLKQESDFRNWFKANVFSDTLLVEFK